MVPHFWTPKVRVTGMKYPWPLPDPDPVLDEALDIAFGYLEATGQAKNGDDMQHFQAPYSAPGLGGQGKKYGLRTLASYWWSEHAHRQRGTTFDWMS